MEISHFTEEESVSESLRTLSILPRLESHPSFQNESANQQAEPGPPHEALFLVLAYLPVFELLNMSEVCMSLRDAVNRDLLPWLTIIVDRPLSSRLSDEILMKIASKANCRLRTLILRNCTKITDDGLEKVIEKNPYINKLHLPACTGLTPEGIIKAVKILSQHPNSLKSLQINGIYNLKKQHLETLYSYLQMNPSQHKPQHILYHIYRISPSSRSTESGRIVDVDICPQCNEVQIVFDCSRETCMQKRDRLVADCRGCNFCISRCEECGGCIDAEEQEDAACADILCSDCWLCLSKCNYCNKPYCKRHTNQQFSSPGFCGFICEACHMTSEI
ncbi:F-box protein SKIP28 [Ricinus communis]|uniref:F-box domain-containing protein n=1 Tax=Ricinus communis TaxID=3988 RepID=B9SP54_RICCO|nr:F-box protein SKIP28 [Ricinus communis]EEF34583.1 conserved hypothetical protein [Ricinus communis]|eukprot:XP_002527773.1 F-box protein SKIP28 [Ricinus communis]